MDHLTWKLAYHFNGTLPAFVLLNSMKVTEDPDASECFKNGTQCPTRCPNMNATLFEPHFGEGKGYQENWLHGLASYYGFAASFSIRNWMYGALRDGFHKQSGMSECVFLSRLFMDVYAMRCYGVLGGIFGDAAATSLPTQEGSSGWSFVEYQMHGEERKKYKPGWVADQPGSKLLIMVDSRFPELAPDANASAAVSFLASYEHMGKARISCYSGCQCREYTLNGHNNRTRTSLTTLKEFKISQSQSCGIQIEVRKATRGDGRA
eukprot:gene17899-24291_t